MPRYFSYAVDAHFVVALVGAAVVRFGFVLQSLV